VAAPTESRTPNWHRANLLTEECGWKGGDRGGLAEWEQIERKKKEKCALTSTGLLMELHICIFLHRLFIVGMKGRPDGLT